MYRLSTCELVGTEVVESKHVCMPLDSSGGAAVPSAEVGIGRIFSGGRDMLGLRRQSWLMLLNEKSEVLYISILCLELDSSIVMVSCYTTLCSLSFLCSL
jgi:hypothetical protein